MECPHCGSLKTSVVDSRYKAEIGQKRRKRRCKECGKLFITMEQLVGDVVPPRIIKRDGRREAFDPVKLRQGVVMAVAKSPISTEEIDKLVTRITMRLVQISRRELKAERVGEIAMRELEKVDRPAYIRFASVYRRFKDAGAFRSEAEKMEPDSEAGKPGVLRGQKELPIGKADAETTGKIAAQAVERDNEE